MKVVHFVSLHKIVLYQVFHEDIISASSTRILALCNFNLWIKVLQLQESLLLYFGGFCFVLFCFSFFCSFSGPIFRNPRILYSDLLSRPIIFLKNWSWCSVVVCFDSFLFIFCVFIIGFVVWLPWDLHKISYIYNSLF